MDNDSRNIYRLFVESVVLREQSDAYAVYSNNVDDPVDEEQFNAAQQYDSYESYQDGEQGDLMSQDQFDNIKNKFSQNSNTTGTEAPARIPTPLSNNTAQGGTAPAAAPEPEPEVPTTYAPDGAFIGNAQPEPEVPTTYAPDQAYLGNKQPETAPAVDKNQVFKKYMGGDPNLKQSSTDRAKMKQVEDALARFQKDNNRQFNPQDSSDNQKMKAYLYGRAANNTQKPAQQKQAAQKTATNNQYQLFVKRLGRGYQPASKKDANGRDTLFFYDAPSKSYKPIDKNNPRNKRFLDNLPG